MTSAKSSFQISDVLLELSVWIGLIRKYFKRYLLVALIGGGLGITYATLYVPKYRADLRFMMRTDASGLASQLSSLNSLFGGGTSSSGTPAERIIELIGTEKVVANALLTTSAVNAKEDLLINHYMRLHELPEKWQKDSILSHVTFSKQDRFETFNFGQRMAFKKIYKAMVSLNSNDGIITRSLAKKTAIITITAIHFNEEFAIALAKAMYMQLTDFYVNEVIASTRRNVQILTHKSDSIRNELEQTRRAYAQNTDKTLGILLQQNKVENKSLAVRENMLTLMYAEVQKNLETLKFMEESSAPSFSVIDMPYSPIDPSLKSRVKYGLFGAFVFAFLLIITQRGILFVKSLGVDWSILNAHF